LRVRGSAGRGARWVIRLVGVADLWRATTTDQGNHGQQAQRSQKV